MIDNIERTWKGMFYANEWVNYRSGGGRHSIIGVSTGSYYLYDDTEASLSIMLTRLFDLKKCEDWVKMEHPSVGCIGRNNFKYSLYMQDSQDEGVLPIVKLAKEKINRPAVHTKPAGSWVGAFSKPAGSWAEAFFKQADLPEGCFPNENSLLKIQGESVVVSACYMDGGKTNLRMFEVGRQHCQVSIEPFFKWRAAEVVDFLGAPIDRKNTPVVLDDSCFHLELNPGEIVTFAIELEKR